MLKYKKFIDCKNFIIIGSFESNIYPIKKIIKKILIHLSHNLKLLNLITINSLKNIPWRLEEERTSFLNNLKEAIDSNYKIKLLAGQIAMKKLTIIKKFSEKD